MGRIAALFLACLGLLLAGCSTTSDRIPDPGRDAPTLSDVRSAPEPHQGATVRWGGTIAGVENRQDVTLVEVVGRTLDRSGQPRSRDTSQGRFLAVIDGFIDPAVYEEGRSITVTGTVDGEETRPVGEHAYRYVRVRARGHHLWPEPRPDPYAHDPRYHPGPFYGPRYGPWYDPWYDPWYPHHRGFRY